MTSSEGNTFNWSTEVVCRDGVLGIDLSPGTQRRANISSSHPEDEVSTTLLILAWVSLLNDIPQGIKRPSKKEVVRFLNKISVDLFTEIARYSNLGDDLIKKVKLQPGFSFSIEESFRSYQGTPVFLVYQDFYKKKSITSFTYLLTFLWFAKKLNYSNTEDLESMALRQWIEVELRLASLEFDDVLLSNLRRVLQIFFEDFTPGPFLPRHGNGSVSEVGIVGHNEKNSRMDFPHRLNQYYLRKRFRSIEDLPLRSSHWYGHPVSSGDEIVSSRLKFVPKSWKAVRSICMEPAAFQYAQQGVRLWIEDYLQSSALKRRVVLSDQTVNQRAARSGSLSGRRDTIDLSAASDSVSWTLVKRVFPAKVLKHLAATRTKYVTLPSGEPFRVNKFAPMGSALCFPVQSILYSAVITLEYVAHIRKLASNDLSLLSDPKKSRKIVLRVMRGDKHGYVGQLEPFHAYGDDLIVDSLITSNVIGTLTKLGFQVNTDKSFMGQSAFRESCGAFFLNGFRVNPYYLRIPALKAKVSVADAASIIDSANRAYSYGYPSVRRVLVRFLLFNPIVGVRRRSGKNPILFSDDPLVVFTENSMSLYAIDPKNAHLKSRKAGSSGSALHYQRDELCSVTLAPRDVVAVEDDDYNYIVWQRTRYSSRGAANHNDVVGLGATVEARGLAPRMRWTAS